MISVFPDSSCRARVRRVSNQLTQYRPRRNKCHFRPQRNVRMPPPQKRPGHSVHNPLLYQVWVTMSDKFSSLTSKSSLVGSILVRFGPNLGSKLFGFLIFYSYPCSVAIALSLIASNVAGYTKKTVATAMAFIGYCAGNIIGPFLFFAREKPKYPVRKSYVDM